MSLNTEYPSETRGRKQSADAINRVMTRFPLLLEILGELAKAQVPHPGDDDIRLGCERTLTTLLVELAKIEPAPAGKSSKSEDIAHSWLKSKEAIRLVDVDKLQRMEQVIEGILGPRL